MSRQRVAIVEDEPAIAEVLAYNLERAGYTVSVHHAGRVAYDALVTDPPDLVLMDLMLPEIDGLELTRQLKRHPATAGLPVIMVTARSEEVDRIVGLELGADDYVTKPFSPREIVLRVKAVLRRSAEARESAAESEWLRAGAIEVDVGGHRARVSGEEISLTATELRLLSTLVGRAGRVQTRGQLLTEVWDYAADVDSRTVDTHVRRLRKKLGDASDQLETVIGVGYRLRRE